MSTRMLAFRTAEQQVKNYAHESLQLMQEHHAAMDCRDCEDFLQLGIDAFQWLIRADQLFRVAVYESIEAYDQQLDERLQHLFRQWLGPCDYAEKWIERQTAKGYHLDNLEKFRECCREMAAIVEALDAGSDEQLPDAIAELRDRAIEEFNRGETAEFFSKQESDHA